MKIWTSCNLEAAGRVAEEEGNPAALAVWASGLCQREEAAFEAVLATAYRRGTVSKMMIDFKAKQLEANTSKIIKARVETRFPVIPAPEPAKAVAPDASAAPVEVPDVVSQLRTSAAPPATARE